VAVAVAVSCRRAMGVADFPSSAVPDDPDVQARIGAGIAHQLVTVPQVHAELAGAVVAGRPGRCTT